MKKIKYGIGLLTICILSILSSLTVIASTGWKQDNGSWYYYEGTTLKTGWMWNNEIKYYLGNDGVMKTGWQKIDGSWYYFKSNGAMHTGWWNDGGVWYYLTLDGSMAYDCYGPDGHWLESSGVWNADKADWAKINEINERTLTGNKDVDRLNIKRVTFIVNWDTDSKDGLVGDGTRDLAVTSALLGRTSTDALLPTEKEVYEVAKAFLDNNIKKSDSDEVKVKKIVNYLYSTINYNYNGTAGPYGALVNKSTLCDGYTRAFKVLANASGLECYYVSGTNINGKGHAWNVVRVNGNWTNVDASANKIMLTDDEFSKVDSTRNLYYKENVPACN